MAPDSISVEDKRQALERVLSSRTFGRSERLRAFLRYVCEAEFEGRAQQINEYALGVSVLGRSPEYSPAEDSSVRTRAYELRNKLRSYYESEASEDPIQIEIDKGAYVPRFARRDTAATIAPSPPQPAPPARWPVGPRVGVALALLLFLVFASVFFLARGRQPSSAKGPAAAVATRELAALWKPFVDSDAPLLIAFETRLFFFAPATGLVVRDYRTNQPADAAKSKPLLEFQARMGAAQLEERLDYADFGAVHAAFLLGRLLNREVGLKHANALGWQDIWNSNIVFLGRPNLNPTIRYSLQGKDFVDEYGVSIRNLHPLPGEPELYRMSALHGAGEKYGLITVMPGPQPGRRMMILSSSAAEVMWALAEAVTNPARVHEIMSRVISPSGESPPAFQIVIAASFESNVPVKIRYVTHRVSKP
jgi:hypothetical protein